MSFKTGLYSYLTGKTEITSLVGDRIFDHIAPERTAYPFLLFEILSGEKSNTLSGQDIDANMFVQFTIIAKSGLECESIGEALRNILSGYRGQMGSLNITSCYYRNETDDYDRPIHGEDKNLFIKDVDYSIWYTENTPSL